MLIIIAGIVAGVLLSGIIYTTTGFSLFGEYHEEALPASDMHNAELASLAYTVLEYIHDGDYNALAKITHPEYGIVFSPYATINLTANKCFQSGQVAAFGEDTNLYVWGVYSGSGEPIELTPGDYFREFVYGKDYLSAPVVGINHLVRSGNALENITDVFRDAQFVDFHIPGSETNGNEDFGWSSLRLGFEEYDGNLRLTVILHSEWTA